MTFIPIINKDTSQITAYWKSLITDANSQRKLVLVIVCVALLLDNMLYMVIVPIMPSIVNEQNRKTAIELYAGEAVEKVKQNFTHLIVTLAPITNTSLVISTQKSVVNPTFDDTEVGLLFASKAIVQLLINPITGAIIDRIGYDIPMMNGLIIIFISTMIFAFGDTLTLMFIARSLQGVGSAFADTSGLAMIADRYTVESERSQSLGIALAFISFGSLVAPPFGGFLYGFFGKQVPFVILALMALADGFVVILVMKPVRKERWDKKVEGKLLKGTPIHKLLVDREIAICAGALAMANVSLAFLEPTIAHWMELSMKAKEWQQGFVWLPAFIPHVAGVYTTVKLARSYPQYQWLMAAIGLALEGTSCLMIPFCNNFITLCIPIAIICYGIALVDTALLPTLGYLVDTRYVSVYGSIYAIADISYSLAYAIGPVVAGSVIKSITFLGLNIAIFVLNIAYVPVMYLLRDIYKYKEMEIEEGYTYVPPVANDDFKPGVAISNNNDQYRTFEPHGGKEPSQQHASNNVNEAAIDKMNMASSANKNIQQQPIVQRSFVAAKQSVQPDGNIDKGRNTEYNY